MMDGPNSRGAGYRLWPDLLAIGFVGLTPLLWLTPGTIVTGGDANFPLDPIQWFKGRSFVWNDLSNCGIPAAINSTSLFFHGLQALGAWLSLPLFHIQQLFYVFWFTAVCGAIYYLMAVIQRDRPDRLERFLAVAFYAYNPLLFNVWEAAKAAELSALVGMPIFLAWLILGMERRLPLWVLACRATLLAVVASEVGAGPPVLAVAIALPSAYAICRILQGALQRRRAQAGWTAVTLAVLCAAYASASAYWAIPYGFEIYDQVLTQASKGLAAFNLDDWLRGISTHTSLLNVSRLQGAWDWYYIWNKEPYVAYAKSYSRSPLLILLSFAFPLLAYSALLVRRSFLALFFASLTLMMTILGSGAHPPFGPIYLFAVERLPLLNMFRSPYYKFGLLVTLGYAVLLAVAIRGWIDRFRLNPRTWGAALIGLNLLYCYPMLTGEIVYIHKTMPFIKLRVPPYITAAARWFDAQPEEGRILSIPKDSMDIYRWGYSSIVHALNLASRRAVLSSRDFVAGFESANTVRESIYRMVFDKLTPWSGRLLGLLGAKYLLVRYDSWYNFYENTDSPARWSQALRWQEGIRMLARLGGWWIYRTEATPPKLFAVPKATLVKSGSAELGALASRPDTERPAWLFTDGLTPLQVRDLLETRAVSAVVLHQADWRELLLDLAGPSVVTPFPAGVQEMTFPLAEEGLFELWIRFLPTVRPEDEWEGSMTVNHRHLLWPTEGQVPRIRGEAPGAWHQVGRVYLPAGTQHLSLAVDNRWIKEVAVIPAETADRYRSLLSQALADPTIEVSLTLSTEQMRAVVVTPNPADWVRIRSTRNFYESGPWWEDHEPWRWVRRYWNNLTIKNDVREPIRRNLELTVYSPASDRALYLHLNNELVEYPPVWAGTSRRMVFRGLQFKPGRNTVALHCPHAGVRAHEPSEPLGTRAYTLGFQNIRVGPARFTTRADIPRPGIYEVTVFPRPVTRAVSRRIAARLRAHPDHVWLTCYGRPVDLTWSEPIATGYRWLRGTVALEAGPATFQIHQLDEENYDLVLVNPGVGEPPEPIPLTYERLTPTQYVAQWPKERNGFLVFLNAYHPRWWVGRDNPSELHRNPKGWARIARRFPEWSVTHASYVLMAHRVGERYHYQANGYANAWYLDARPLDATTLTLAYFPQALFEVGIVISLLTVVLGGLGVLIWGLAKMRQR